MHASLIREEEMWWGTCLEYEGDKEGLLAAGVGYPALFRVGKSGKRIVQRGFGETDEFIVERLKTKWRVTIDRKEPEPLAAPGVWILYRSVDNDGIERTWYVGTKKALLASGFASTHMFRLEKKTHSRSNMRRTVPIHKRFFIRRFHAYWELMLFQELAQLPPEPPDCDVTTGNIIPFPRDQF